jgi:hypothetical protein
MRDRHFFTSVTRISPLPQGGFSVQARPVDEWQAGDYVVCEVEVASGIRHLELTTGRTLDVVRGDRFVGALGKRAATLESTGDWREVGPDGEMNLLTGAGLVGRIVSRSPFLPAAMAIRYQGHVVLDGSTATMRRFVPAGPERAFHTPTILVVGTSMSSGKTTAGQTLVRRLVRSGRRVLAAKITGAARYKDVLSMGDAGAEWIYDFVDVGLPSTVHPEEEYRQFAGELLSRMAAEPASAAVVELGASPLEPYNGTAAMELLAPAVRCTVLAASDAYAARGLLDASGIRPDLVCGPAANTRAGIVFTEQLCGVKTLNLSNPSDHEELDWLLEDKLGR